LFRRQGKVAGRGMEIINYKYKDRKLVADRNIDEIVEQTWSSIEKESVLRYEQPKTNPHATYIDKGEFKFVFQFLQNRGSLRRARVQFDSINEAFSSERFQFLKIKNEKEFLFKMKTENYTATAIVNVSPIEWGHFLLVAELESAFKQRLT